MNIDLLRKMEKIEGLARASKFKRLLNNPINYLNGTLFNKFIYPINKKGRFVTAQTFFGVNMNLILPSGMDIYLCGGKTHDSEIRLTKFLIKNLKEKDVFVDVGTHFGFYSLLASQLVGDDGKVIGVEASAAIFEVYLKNISPKKNIYSNHIAATDKKGSLTFYEFPISHSEYNTFKPEQFDSTDWINKNPPNKIKVAGKKLDSLLIEKNIHPKIIKIDVEGAENNVILGLEKTLADGQPTISMEYLVEDRQNTSHKAAAKQLIDWKYLPHIITADGTLTRISDIDGALEERGLDSDNLIFCRLRLCF